MEKFPECEVLDAVPVFNENGEHFSWILPVTNNGSYVGYLIAFSDDFELPDSYVIYGEARETFISRDKAADIEALLILSHGEYSDEEIKEPYFIIKNDGGYAWLTEVVRNGRIIDRLYNEVELQ
jgi:hypothetical protein